MPSAQFTRNGSFFCNSGSYHLNTVKGTGKVYVSSRTQPRIWVIDQKSLKVIDEIKLPAGEGHQMAVVSAG